MLHCYSVTPLVWQQFWRWWGWRLETLGWRRWQIWSARMFVLNWGGSDWWKRQLVLLLYQYPEEGGRIWDLSEKMWECVQYTSRPWSSGRHKKYNWDTVLSTTRAGRLSARYGLEYKVGMVEIWSRVKIYSGKFYPLAAQVSEAFIPLSIIMEDQIKSTQMLVHSFYNHPGISFL